MTLTREARTRMHPDENRLFREATIRVCSSLELDRALHDTILYLRNFMPLDEISIQAYERDLGVFRQLTRVNADGVTLKGDPVVVPVQQEIRELIEELARLKRFEVLVINRPLDHPMADQRTAERFGVSGKSLLVLGTALLPGAFFFTAEGYDRYQPEHVRLVEMLKEPFIIALSNAMRYEEVVRFRDRLASENRNLQQALHRRSVETLIGAETGLRGVIRLVQQVAQQNSPVLLFGETGTGKEVVAKAIHRQSANADGPLVTVNCGGIPETLIDSELFGHEKGAFTGAIEAKRGHFEHAHGGTIFLDEIGELPHAAQVKLLRVLQSMEFHRVGGGSTVTVDVRVIAATNRDLETMVRDGQFREDLWFRLNVFPIEIPPLRERREDVPALAHHFIEAKAREMNLGARPRLAPGAIDALIDYDWPGNVRELENVIERALIESRGEPLAFPELGPHRVAGSPAIGRPARLLPLDQAVAEHIRSVLSHCNGRVSGEGGAAALLGINASTLRSRMKKLGVPFGRGAD